MQTKTNIWRKLYFGTQIQQVNNACNDVVGSNPEGNLKFDKIDVIDFVIY